MRPQVKETLPIMQWTCFKSFYNLSVFLFDHEPRSNRGLKNCSCSSSSCSFSVFFELMIFSIEIPCSLNRSAILKVEVQIISAWAWFLGEGVGQESVL